MSNIDSAPVSRAADKVGVLGTLVSAIGCAACFPALGSLGAAIGLGFLSQYEGVFIRILLPLFAVVGLMANVVSWRRHRQPLRGVLSVIGPLLVLAAVFVMRTQGVRTGFLLYPGLALMFSVAIWDLISKPSGRVRNLSTDQKSCC